MFKRLLLTAWIVLSLISCQKEIEKAPTALFSIENNDCTATCEIVFTNKTESATTYDWNFGDGTTSTEHSPRHTYTKAGTYQVKLIAEGKGGSNTLSQTVTIKAPAAPVAAFTISNNGCTAPCTVGFTNQSTNATSYAWEFGEGSTSSQISPSHTYAKAGSYTVKLAATGSGGTHSLTRNVTITIAESLHLSLGNPTNAKADLNLADNYLMVKPQYALSYSRSKAHANWVSWHLDEMDLGSAERQDEFRPDTTLLSGWYRALPSDFTNSGFDRGHLCPSADRSKTIEDNAATFLMTNIIPQSPALNREPWAYLEQYCRDVVKEDNQLFIVAGTYGSGGEGSKGTSNQLNGKINVPSGVWKVIVAFPENVKPENAFDKAQIIAVDMPNQESLVNNTNWLQYITTPEAIEQKSGTTFFSSVPATVRSQWKTKKFKLSESDFNVDTQCRVYNGRQLFVGPKGGCYYINSNGNKSYVDRELCNCSNF